MSSSEIIIIASSIYWSSNSRGAKIVDDDDADKDAVRKMQTFESQRHLYMKLI